MSDALKRTAGEGAKLSRSTTANGAVEVIHFATMGDGSFNTALVERSAAFMLNNTERRPRAPRGRRGNREYRNHPPADDDAPPASGGGGDITAAQQLADLREHEKLQRDLLDATKLVAEERSNTIDNLHEEVSALCDELERMLPGSSGKVRARVAERRAGSSAAPVAVQQQPPVGPANVGSAGGGDDAYMASERGQNKRERERDERTRRERSAAPRAAAMRGA